MKQDLCIYYLMDVCVHDLMYERLHWCKISENTKESVEPPDPDYWVALRVQLLVRSSRACRLLTRRLSVPRDFHRNQ